MVNNLWTEEMLNVIRSNSDKLSDREIAIILNKTQLSITWARTRYGIKKDYSSIRKIMFKEGKIVCSNKGKNTPQEQIEKRLKTLFKNGNNKAWNKGMKGVQVAWNKGLTLEDPRVKKYIKTRLENFKIYNPMPRGVNNPLYGKTKENCDILKKSSERMKNGGAMKAMAGNKRPTKPERVMMDIIEKNNLPFNYVGKGDITFKGINHSFNPDFLSKNPKHIIEVFGDYWHNLPGIEEKDKERLETYSKYGYKTLVIWESELLKNKKMLPNYGHVIDKINKFIGGN